MSAQTPRTDALMATLPSTMDTPGDANAIRKVVDLCRQLERELASLRAPQSVQHVRVNYKLGQCIKCGNPLDHELNEHFVGATASAGDLSPEVLTPQRVEAPQSAPSSPATRGWAIKGPDGGYEAIALNEWQAFLDAGTAVYDQPIHSVDYLRHRLLQDGYTCVPVLIVEDKR